ncbi:MAG: hypothetical protein DIU68_019250 [Chloroflexota bacterium]|mgnify:CR=1 FL=1|nr:MAG: hypothetical protein DIU68_12430 [Chloroflexota bacterium]
MATSSAERGEIRVILAAYLDGQPYDGLAYYLMEKSNLPGPRMNLGLANNFADAVGELVSEPQTRVERLEMLLDTWARLPVDQAPVNHPRVILPCVAVLSYGQAAVSRPEWWDDEIAKLERAATDPRWRVREMVAAALQRMLAADWTRTCGALMSWIACGEPLRIRAAVAAVAEPGLLADKQRAEDALAVQAEAVNQFIHFSPEQRRDENVRALRQALGYTLSVVTAASPETGFHLMEELAALPDPDIVWIVRENMKKKRLEPWQDRLTTLETALFRPEQADAQDDE